MTVLKEVQPRVHALTGGLFANWLPPDQVEVGDYGVITRERFQRDGNLRNWNIACEIETPGKADGKLEYSDRVQVQAGAALKAGAQVPGQKSPKASAKISFKGQGAFLYHLSGITSRRLANSRTFYEELACKWLAGEVRLEENSVIVNEIRVADKATIIVSEGHEGSLELQGDFSLNGQAVLADVKGGLSVSASTGSLFQWLAADGTIPIISLIRPVMGPPDGGPTSPGGVAAVLTRVRNLFRKGRWDIRIIQLRGFSETPAVITVTAELPNGEIVAVGFHAIDAAEFLSLNEYVAEATTFVVDNVEEEDLGRGQAAASA